MSRVRGGLVVLATVVLALASAGLKAGASGEEVTKAEYEQMKKELDDLKRQLESTTPIGPSSPVVDEALDNKYGPNARVSTRAGRLTIGGLLQVWFYSIQNDNRGWVDTDALNGGPGAGWGSNEVNDNDSFRVRRSELRFNMDITENISAYISIDPAREATSFPSFPANVSTGASNSPGGVIGGDGVAFTNPGVGAPGGNGTEFPLGHVRNGDVRTGGGAANRALQDAYINYHGVIPHHDFTVGQFKRRLGEEGTRDSKDLDFVERAMITQLADLRDLGIRRTVRGGMSACSTGSAGSTARARLSSSARTARTITISSIVGTILVRPLWNDEKWGSIEIGYSYLGGLRGEDGRPSRTAP
ncbi:MAG: hypothetical protein HS116_27520 [Planctomycetes bacterium]|nr:hypothetical protein [Planctomycetota bacterium]